MGCWGAGVVRLAVAAASVAACEPVRDVLEGPAPTPHEAYAEALRDAGLDRRAAGSGWLAAADEALEQPLPVTLPFRETGVFPADEIAARGYRIAVRRGERLVVTVEAEGEAVDSARGASSAGLFVDLFKADPGEESGWDLIESGDSVLTALRHEVDDDGLRLVRLQPELLRVVRYTLTIQVEPTLAFPVEGHDAGDIRSRFGADRDAGRRVHHGVDIFAPRGTPVLAAAEGVVQPGTNRLGGNVVWQRVPGVGSLYYAHLDRQAVEPGEIARPGDTVGFVGNTGNAVTTPPHLHFGIYGRPRGPVDPFPFLYHPEEEPAEPLAADVQLGHFMRTTARRSVLRTGPDADAAEIDTVVSGTIARVIGGAAEWRRVSLADGRTGFLRANELEPAARPAATERTTAETPVWARPDSSSLAVATLPAGAEVAVLGSLGDWRLIALDGERGDTAGAPPRARSGWIPGG